LNFSVDDGIVVVEVEKGVCPMESAVRTLRAKLGDDAMSDLETLLDDSGRRWKDDVLAITGERFERRLSEEIGALRVDMAKEFAAVRVDMAKEFGAVRVEMATLAASMHSDTLETRAQMVALAGSIRGEMATLAGATRADILKMGVDTATLAGATRSDILKWSFLFWIGQFAAFSAMMTFLMRTVGPR
jgi:hypothetical protein